MYGVPKGDGGSIAKEFNGKKMKFKRAYTPKRWTFIIDEDGIITRIDKEVNTSEDGKIVLDFLKSQ